MLEDAELLIAAFRKFFRLLTKIVL